MSLQVWLPLNGNLNNLGLTPVTLSSGTPTYTTAGKLGKCLNTGALQFNVSNNLIVNIGNTKQYSIGCWYKNLSTSSSSRWVFCIGNGTGTTRGLWENNSTTTRQWAYSGSGVNINSTINSIDGNWHHIMFIVNGATVQLYIDGIYQSENSNTKTNALTSNRIYLNAVDYNFNDFRLYDHVLSAKEVEEIAKALVLHYPLDGWYVETSSKNKYSSPYSEGSLSSSSFVKTKLTNERGYNYTYTRTGNGTNFWASANVPPFTFTPDKTYYYSVKVRCNKWTTGGLVLRAARCDNDWVTRSVTVCSPSLADGEWHEYYTYQTIPASFDRSGTTITSNPRLEFYSGNLNVNDTLYDFDFDIKDIQVVESDHYIPFQDGTYFSNIIYDCSGYGNDGTVVGSLETTTPSSRYDYATSFNENTDSITITPYLSNGQTLNEITVSCWFKTNTLNGTTPNIFSLGENAFLRSRLASATSIWNYYRVVSTQKATTYSCKNLIDNNWHLLTFTFQDGVEKTYIDGEQIGSTDQSSTGTYLTCNTLDWHLAGYRANFENFIGSLSDFRIYATTLTEAQIKELYTTAAAVDKNGNIYARELVEV